MAALPDPVEGPVSRPALERQVVLTRGQVVFGLSCDIGAFHGVPFSRAGQHQMSHGPKCLFRRNSVSASSGLYLIRTWACAVS